MLSKEYPAGLSVLQHILKVSAFYLAVPLAIYSLLNGNIAFSPSSLLRALPTILGEDWLS